MKKYLVFLILLASCLDGLSQGKNKTNPFIGVWESGEFMYYLKLTIRNDNTFTYYTSSDEGFEFTEGIWSIQHSSKRMAIVLTSYDKYIKADSLNLVPKQHNTKNQSFISHDDTDLRYFNKCIYILDKDSLYDSQYNREYPILKFVKRK